MNCVIITGNIFPPKNILPPQTRDMRVHLECRAMSVFIIRNDTIIYQSIRLEEQNSHATTYDSNGPFYKRALYLFMTVSFAFSTSPVIFLPVQFKCAYKIAGTACVFLGECILSINSPR